MADFDPENGLNILSNSSDPDGDAISVRKLGTSVGTLAVPGSYPATYNLTIGSITVLNAQGDAYVTLASSDGTNKALGTLYFTDIDSKGAESVTPGVVTINQIAPPSASGYVDTGLAERWAADAGTTLSGSDVTTWDGQILGLSLAAVGTPILGTPVGGTASATMIVDDAEGFLGSTTTGLPFGAQARTWQMIWEPGSGPFFGGFGNGSDASNSSFILSVDDAGELALDYRNGRVFTGIKPASQWVTITATYDGTTVDVWVGDALIASVNVALSTGVDTIRVCRSFSNQTTLAEIGEVLCYGRVLSEAEIVANVSYLNGRFIGSLSVTAPDTPTGSVLAETSFTATVTGCPANSPIIWSARASSTPATEAQILAGTGAISFGMVIANGDGVATIPVTGGAASTGYYVNVLAYGLTGGKSSVVTSAAITTTAAPGANPILSSYALGALGQVSATASVDTDTGNGTLKFGIFLATANYPTADQLEAGTDGDGGTLIAGLRTAPITGTGAQSMLFTGLTPGTAYRGAVVQRDGSNNRSNLITFTFTTNTATSSLTPDATASTKAGIDAILASWVGGANTPAGKAMTDTRVVQLTADIGAATFSGYDFSAITGGVILRGAGSYTWDTSYPFNPRCSSHVAGLLRIQNCNNLQVYGITCQKFQFANSVRAVVDRVSAQSRWATSRSVPTASEGLQIDNCPGAVVRRCHVSGFRDYSVTWTAGCDDLLIEQCYVEQWSDDCFRGRIGSATVSRVILRRNTVGRDNLSVAGAHSDFLQIFTGSTPDLEFWGNLSIDGDTLNNIKLNAMAWLSDSNVSDRVRIEQNLGFLRGQNCYFFAGGANTLCDENDATYAVYGAVGSVQPATSLAPQIDSFATKNRNIASRHSTGNADTSGTDGEILTVGNLFGGTSVANTSGYPALYEGIPGHTRYIEEIKPPVGAVTHWSFGGTKKGAYQRKEEIFVDGLHPENDGWPNAKRFRLEYNPNDVLPTTYTGTVDADGVNA